MKAYVMANLQQLQMGPPIVGYFQSVDAAL